MHTKTPLPFFSAHFFFSAPEDDGLRHRQAWAQWGSGLYIGGEEGRWIFLAATSEKTGHLGIRSIRACVPVSRFMVASHWNITSLLDRGGEAGVFSPFFPSPSFITRLCNSMKPWNRHTRIWGWATAPLNTLNQRETLHSFRCENLTFLLLNLSRAWISEFSNAA